MSGFFYAGLSLALLVWLLVATFLWSFRPADRRVAGPRTLIVDLLFAAGWPVLLPLFVYRRRRERRDFADLQARLDRVRGELAEWADETEDKDGPAAAEALRRTIGHVDRARSLDLRLRQRLDGVDG